MYVAALPSPTRRGSATTRSAASTSASTTATLPSAVRFLTPRSSPLPASPRVRVASAAESAACDQAAIAAGIPSRALMRVAGTVAASEIARRFGAVLSRGVSVYAGPGNNGGDAWVVADALAASGVWVLLAAGGDLLQPGG